MTGTGERDAPRRLADCGPRAARLIQNNTGKEGSLDPTRPKSRMQGALEPKGTILETPRSACDGGHGLAGCHATAHALTSFSTAGVKKDVRTDKLVVILARGPC